ncbi:hypothetical protein ACSTIC_23645, partial [Vibrio parahaemolyticus]
NPLFVVNGRTGINPSVAAAMGRTATGSPLRAAAAGADGKPVVPLPHVVTVDAGMTVRAYAMQGVGGGGGGVR